MGQRGDKDVLLRLLVQLVEKLFVGVVVLAARHD